MRRGSCWGPRETAPGRRAGPGRSGAPGRVRQCGSRRVRARARSPAGRGAVPGHLPGHRLRHLGGRGDGRLGRHGEQLLAAVRASRREQHVEAGHPARHPDNGGLVLADGGAQSLITGFRPSQYLTYTPLIVTRDAGRAWSSAGPLDGALANLPHSPAAWAGANLAGARLTRPGRDIAALLTAGTGPAASLLAAWSADDGSHWTLSQALPLHGAALASASFGSGGAAAVITTANRAEIIDGAGSSWRPPPPLPPATATPAPGTGRAG